MFESWQDKVYKRMQGILAGEGYKFDKKLVDNLYTVYLANGERKITAEILAAKSGVDIKIAKAFLLALQDAALTGEIGWEIYSPSEAAVVKQDFLSKVNETIKYFFNNVFITVGMALILMFMLNKKRS